MTDGWTIGNVMTALGMLGGVLLVVGGVLWGGFEILSNRSDKIDDRLGARINEMSVKLAAHEVALATTNLRIDTTGSTVSEVKGILSNISQQISDLRTTWASQHGGGRR